MSATRFQEKSEKYWKYFIHEQKGFIYKILILFSLLYSLIIRIKLFLYKKNILGKFSFSKTFVLCVGNISVGGSGKTPFVEYLSKLMTEFKIKTSVISRGYASRNETDDRLRIVTNGREILLKQSEAGDEPYMLALKLKKIPIILDRTRVQAIKYAYYEFDSRTVILDDGLQRRNIVKDMEIVVFDGTVPLKLYKMFPAGILREPMSVLESADVCVINKTSENNELLNLIRMHNSSVPVFYSEYIIESFHRINDDSAAEIEKLKHKKIVLFCGIGNPENFKTLIEKTLEPEYVMLIDYPDHYGYGEKEIKRIKMYSEVYDYIITTHKDAVKLKYEFDNIDNLLYTLISVDISEKEKFNKIIEYYIKCSIEK